MNKIYFSFFICLLLFGIFFCNAEDSDDNTDPDPYEKEEFSEWILDLRRAEIIFFGLIPLALGLTFEVYDIFRYYTNNMDPLYKPWPFKEPNAATYETEEQIGIIITAVSISALITLADFIIEKIFYTEIKDKADKSEKS